MGPPSQPSEGTGPDFSPPESGDGTFLLCKPLSLRSFVHPGKGIQEGFVLFETGRVPEDAASLRLRPSPASPHR